MVVGVSHVERHAVIGQIHSLRCIELRTETNTVLESCPAASVHGEDVARSPICHHDPVPSAVRDEQPRVTGFDVDLSGIRQDARR